MKHQAFCSVISLEKSSPATVENCSGSWALLQCRAGTSMKMAGTQIGPCLGLGGEIQSDVHAGCLLVIQIGSDGCAATQDSTTRAGLGLLDSRPGAIPACVCASLLAHV